MYEADDKDVLFSARFTSCMSTHCLLAFGQLGAPRLRDSNGGIKYGGVRGGSIFWIFVAVDDGARRKNYFRR